jgi:sugar phosphate isomerase/epimerase
MSNPSLSGHGLSRRAFLAASGAAACSVSSQLAFAAPAAKNVPIGLELYSVREDLAKDDTATVRAVAKMGYQVVEFYAPYAKWTVEHARDMRKLMDELGVECHSTHNGVESFAPDAIAKTIELNQILGATCVVVASSPHIENLDGWKKMADQLTDFSQRLKPAGLRTGYHNHQTEFTPLEGKRPIEVIAANTPADVMLQLDVGTCMEVGSDPVAWIKANPGRIRSLHLKDWGPGADKGYRVLFGEGAVPWKALFAAAESVGGVEYYLIEQEGSRYPALETAQKCLEAWKRIHV